MLGIIPAFRLRSLPFSLTCEKHGFFCLHTLNTGACQGVNEYTLWLSVEVSSLQCRISCPLKVWLRLSLHVFLWHTIDWSVILWHVYHSVASSASSDNTDDYLVRFCLILGINHRHPWRRWLSNERAGQWLWWCVATDGSYWCHCWGLGVQDLFCRTVGDGPLGDSFLFVVVDLLIVCCEWQESCS